MAAADQRPTYRLDLRPEPDCERPVVALRRALKCLLRSYGLRCVRAVEVDAAQVSAGRDRPAETPDALRADGAGGHGDR